MQKQTGSQAAMTREQHETAAATWPHVEPCNHFIVYRLLELNDMNFDLNSPTPYM